MTKTSNETKWRTLSHGPIEQLADNLWCVNGSLPGMSLRRNMVVARRRDGALVIHSGIALEESAMRQLESLGTPTYLIVPNRAHRLDAPAYKARYPSLRVYCPKAAHEKVSEVVAVDGHYDAFPHDEDVRLEMLHGVADEEGALIVNSPDGVTVVLNDAMMNMDNKSDVLGYLITRTLGSAPGPRVSRLAKLVFVKDKRALRDDLERFARIPQLVRLIVAHEKVARGPEAARALQQAATYL